MNVVPDRNQSMMFEASDVSPTVTLRVAWMLQVSRCSFTMMCSCSAPLSIAACIASEVLTSTTACVVA